MLEALAAIERLIGENIHDNGTTINRMMVNGEWHTGPVVDASFRILRGLQKIAANALSSLKTGPSRASAQDLSKVTSEQTAAVKWPGLKFCEIAARNVMELARFIKGEDDRAVASDAGLAIRTLLASLNVPTDGSQPGGRSADAAALLDLVREEAFKDNSPFGRSDSLALERIRLALTSSAPKEAS